MKIKLKLAVIFSILIGLAVLAANNYRDQQYSAKVLTGTVETRKFDVTTKNSGYLRQLNVKEGDYVKKGDLAASQERNDLVAGLARDKANYKKAQAQLAKLTHGARQEELDAATAKRVLAQTVYDKAAKDYQRSKDLYKSEAVAKQELDHAIAAMDAAGADLAEANANEALAYAGTRTEDLAAAQEDVVASKAVIDIAQTAVDDLNVYIPADGYILTKNYELGEYVAAGMPIATVVDLSDCWVKVYLSSIEIGKISLGTKAKVVIDASPDKFLKGYVREISDKAEFTPRQSITKNERVNLVFAVKVAVDNSDNKLKPGMPADVILNE